VQIGSEDDEENQSVGTEDRANIIENIITENTTNTNTIIPEQPNPTTSRPNPTIRRRGAPPELQEAGNQMKEAFDMLKNAITKRASDKEDDDEYDLFGKMLAKKIRKLPENEREVFMYEIEGMYIKKLRNMNYFSSHSNASSTAERFDTPSTDYSNPTYQSRPSSSLSSYSEMTYPTYPQNLYQPYLSKNIIVGKQNTPITSENYDHRINRIDEENIIAKAFSMSDEINQ